MEQSLRDYIYEELKKDILYGNLKNGDVLRERNIVSKYVVSRTPVREALQRLKTEGLLTHSSDCVGWQVKIISYDEVEELIYLNVSLVNLLIEDAIPRLTEEDIQAFRITIDEIRETVYEGDIFSAAQICVEWQRMLFGHSKRQRVLRCYDELPCLTNLHWLWDGIEQELHQESVMENITLFELVRRKDVKAFQELYRKHMETYLRWCQETYERNQLEQK